MRSIESSESRESKVMTGNEREDRERERDDGEHSESGTNNSDLSFPSRPLSMGLAVRPYFQILLLQR